MKSGKDQGEWVRSKDDDGKFIWTKDQKIERLPHNPYVGVPVLRQRQLDGVAEDLLKNHIRNGKLDFKDVADIMDDIANNPGLTENERINVWSTIAAKRGASFPVAPEKANPDVLDSHNPADVWHAIITFSDGYHAPMAHSSPAVARATISFHERAGQGADQFRVGPGTGINQGDINASTYQVEALRDYLDGGFSAYAKTWRARFTR